MITYAPKYGLGNIIQTTPTVKYLQTLDEVKISIQNPEWKESIQAVYDGFTIVGPRQDALTSCDPADFSPLGGVSEVQLNLARVNAPGNADRTGFCGYEESGESFDILLCDGYNKSRSAWKVKSWPYWGELAKRLTGHSVASIGHPSEYIEGTVDRTGIGLLETLGLIKASSLLICNDTGFYHAACALGIPCIALFTMTDTDKNHDPIFHKSAQILGLPLDCRPCQLKGKLYWEKQKPICGWKCREIPVEAALNAAKGYVARD